MGAVAQILAGLVVFSVTSTCLCASKDKDKCPGDSLAVIVAQQNKFIQELMTEQVEIELQMTKLRNYMEEIISDLNNQLEECKKEMKIIHSELKSTQAELKVVGDDVMDLKEQLKDSLEKVMKIVDEMKKHGGSTYVRWGRNDCNENSSKLVYSGIVGGKHYTHKGSGTNPLCLTDVPLYDTKTKPAAFSYLYGTEYQHLEGIHDYDVPCSVCQVRESSTIMIPGTNKCPEGWFPQYTGHLVSAYYGHFATEYVCLDGEAEGRPDSSRNVDGHLFYLVINVCGALPCPPYVNDKVVTCAVCTSSK